MNLSFEPGPEFWNKLEKVVNDVVDQKFTDFKRQSKTGGTITVKEAAKFLNVAEITVHEYIKKGLLPAKKIRRRYIIEEDDVKKALSEVKSLKYKRT